jgi:hypothetical protein
MLSNNYNSEQQRARESSRLNIMNIANNANNRNQIRRRIRLINNNATIARIARITTPQITSNPFENDLFNGSSFHYNDYSLESLILPTGYNI